MEKVPWRKRPVPTILLPPKCCTPLGCMGSVTELVLPFVKRMQRKDGDAGPFALRERERRRRSSKAVKEGDGDIVGTSWNPCGMTNAGGVRGAQPAEGDKRGSGGTKDGSPGGGVHDRLIVGGETHRRGNAPRCTIGCRRCQRQSLCGGVCGRRTGGPSVLGGPLTECAPGLPSGRLCSAVGRRGREATEASWGEGEGPR